MPLPALLVLSLCGAAPVAVVDEASADQPAQVSPWAVVGEVGFGAGPAVRAGLERDFGPWLLGLDAAGGAYLDGWVPSSRPIASLTGEVRLHGGYRVVDSEDVDVVLGPHVAFALDAAASGPQWYAGRAGADARIDIQVSDAVALVGEVELGDVVYRSYFPTADQFASNVLSLRALGLPAIGVRIAL